MKELFIVGCGRSGTTMVQQALNRHPQILIPPETGFFSDIAGSPRRLQRSRLRRLEIDLGIELSPLPTGIEGVEQTKAVYGQIARAYTRRLGREGTAYFGDKSPRHLLVAPRLYELFPQAKFILVYRDGRDVAMSLTKVPWAPDDLYLNFEWWLHFWGFHEWMAREPGVDLCTIRYEDFVLDPRQHLERVAEFLELDYEPAMSDGAGNEEGVLDREYWKKRALRPIDSSRVGVWRNELTPVQIATLERRGGHALRSLGYELKTDGSAPLPIFFRSRLYLKRALWLANRSFEVAKRELGTDRR